MKRMLTFFALSLILATAVMAYGDPARSEPSASPSEPKYLVNTGMEIVPDSKAYSARLQISHATLMEIRDALNTGATSQSITQRIAHSSASTIVAGLFLFMSVSFAGVWFARSLGSKSRSQKAVAAVLIGVAMLGAAAIVTHANAGPPPSYLWRNLPKNLNAGRPTSGGVDIEVVPDGVGVKLIVPLRNGSNRNNDDE